MGKVDGNYSYKELAHVFLQATSHRQNFSDFKENLYEYLIEVLTQNIKKKFYDRYLSYSKIFTIKATSLS